MQFAFGKRFRLSVSGQVDGDDPVSEGGHGLDGGQLGPLPRLRREGLAVEEENRLAGGRQDGAGQRLAVKDAHTLNRLKELVEAVMVTFAYSIIVTSMVVVRSSILTLCPLCLT